MTQGISRRTLLAGTAGAVGLAACSSDPSTPTATPTATPTPTPTATATTSSPSAPGWAQLRRSVSGRLALPGEAAYDEVRLLQDPRFDDLRPLAVLTVAGAEDVATAFGFAQDAGVPVAVRSGGHGYAGWSAGGEPPALVVDCRGLDAVELADDGTATIGPGAPLVRVYDALGQKGRAIGAGSCPTVGFGGLALGGGVGVLTGAFGLTCDQVVGLTAVTADGRVLSVSADEEPDLFFALRGGGGGHGALVTSFTVATQEAPTLETAYLQWPADTAPDVLAAWQDWTADAPAEQWSTLKVLAGASRADGPVVLVSATWVGDTGGLDGRLATLLQDLPEPAADSRNERDYLEAMLTYAGCADTPVEACTTDPGGALEREALTATSHVAAEALDDAGIADLVDAVVALQDSGLKEAGVSVDALGGRVRDVAADETAFVHRDALATVQYTATYDGDPVADAQAGLDAVRGLRRTMTPHWGDGAYVNYADAELEDPLRAYFGDNAARLADVRRTYDPDGFFGQPQGW